MANSPALAIVRKDLVLEGRRLEQLALVGLLAFLIMILFRVAAEVTPLPIGTALWVTVVFVLTAGLARSFHAEADQGTLDLLVASPASPAGLYLAKVCASLVVGAVACTASVLFAALFFGGGFARDPLALVLFLALGSTGLAALTAFFSALSARARSRAALFPVLVIPLAVPLMFWAAMGTVAATAGAPLTHPLVWLNLAYLAAYDALFLSLFTFLAPRAMSA